MISARSLSKRYHRTMAVEELGFPGGHQMSASMGFVLVSLYAGTVLAIGGWAFARRDA
jgi:hypothetical protein